MLEYIQLRKISEYSTKRISLVSISLDNYVTTDNLLPNKEGLTKADKVPPNETNIQFFTNEDILISNIRPYLKKIWFSDRDGGCSADVLVIKVDKNIADPKFVYYCLYRDDFFNHMMKGSKGTRMPRGDKNRIMCNS